MLSLKDFKEFEVGQSSIVGGWYGKVLRLNTETGIYLEAIDDDGNFHYFNIIGKEVSRHHVCDKENG